MWGYRAVWGGTYWSLTLHRVRKDGERDRRYAVIRCGLWTPDGAQRALNTPRWHMAPDGATPARWTGEQRVAIRAGMSYIARGGREV